MKSYLGHELIKHPMLKVGHADLIKAKLGTLQFQGCTPIVLLPKRYELGHIDLISCNGLKSPWISYVSHMLKCFKQHFGK